MQKHEKIDFLKTYEGLNHEEAISLLEASNYQLRLVIHNIQQNYDPTILKAVKTAKFDSNQPKNQFFILNVDKLLSNLNFITIIDQSLALYTAGETHLTIHGLARLIKQMQSSTQHSKLDKKFYNFYVNLHLIQHKIPGSVLKAFFIAFLSQEKEFLRFSKSQLENVEKGVEQMSEFYSKYDALMLYGSLIE